MDSFTLNKIEFDEIRRILSGFCSCSLGKELALRISPSRNPEIVQRWLEQVTQMIRAIREVGVPPFGGVTDIRDALRRTKPGAGAGGKDFAVIASALEGAGNVRRYLSALPEEFDQLHELSEGIGEFEKEIEAIRSVVASDGSILDDASPRLEEIRREITSITQRIHDTIYGYLQQPEVARLLQDVHVTLHGDRYVLPVKTENRGRLPGVVHRLSGTGATVFVEPNTSVELNNQLSDLRDDERREIERLLHTLAVRISPRSEQIVSSMQVLAQVDLISGKAQYAYQFEMTRPEITERGGLQFTQARHPLLIDQAWQQERAGLPPEKRHPVVPIDVRLGQDFDLLVVTGSNTGGKTVALKTIALLVVMAQCGMFVPVQRGSTTPIFHDVFIDVGDEQSLQQSLSTFGAHIKRIKYILRKASGASLVLLDELGAGTDPDEGGAIGQSILDELRRIGCLGMATTHLSVLKAYAYTHERVDNASVEFDTGTLTPTYRLRIGTPGESHATIVAQHLGLPKRLISAARRHMTDQNKQFRRAIQATSLVRESAEQARSEAQAAQLAAETEQQRYEAKLADLHRLKEQIETWLARLGELKKGDEIFVPSLGKKCTLVRLELHKQIALVDSDNVQVEVPLRELIPDLGQAAIREEIAAMRQEILEQARQSEQGREEARRTQEEFHRSLQQQKFRARQFDTWLGAIARLKVGDEIPIARKPGKGKVVKMDLPGMRATVDTSEGEMQIMLQELFPQTGPFARRPVQPSRAPRKRAERTPPPPRPMQRRSPESKAAKENRQVLLETEPGQQVYVVPFNKRATLIRIVKEKDQAVVQSGIFEMEIPLADLEPVRESR